jgi:3-oxoacyl-[acyl-carrier protein] reductase
MDLGLQGKVAAIGGASKGIGRATAFGLAAEGCRVAICARGQDALAQTARELEAAGAEVFAMPCDMGKLDDIKRFIKGTVDRFGRLDILVNNAGGPPWGYFDTHDEARWAEAINVSFLSGVRCVQEALPYLKESGSGRIINIASTSIKQPIDGLILSNTTRMATAGLSKTLSRELGPHQITVNTVCPGSTQTDRVMGPARQQATAEGKSIEQVIEEMGASVPLGHIGQPEDVAALVVFLAGDPAKHITGTTVQVDGGETVAVF